MANVDGENFAGAVTENAVGESSGGRTDVRNNQAGNIETCVEQGTFQLETAARDEFLLFAYAKRRVGRQLLPCFFDASLPQKHFPRQNERLGATPRFDETLIDEELIGALLGRFVSHRRLLLKRAKKGEW